MNQCDVKLYDLSTCSHCRDTKDLLNQCGIEYDCVDVDRLEGDQICASSSNRNFIGRQGSARGRTILMSPAMVAAAALAGEITDVRDVL